MKTLIIYGEMWGWVNFDDKILLPHLKNKIDALKVFTDTNKLKKYLETEGKNNKNYILPLTDKHLNEISMANIRAMTPKLEITNIFSNKQLFAEHVKKNNLSRHFPEIFTKPENNNKLVIVKPVYGGGSASVYLSELNKLKASDFVNNTVQEYIHSHMEFAGYFVANKGKIVHSFAYYREYPRDKPYIKTINDKSIQRRTTVDANCITIIEKFMSPVSFTGTFCVDYKFAKDTLIVLEINPRTGASLSYPENIRDAVDVVGHLLDIHK